MPPTPEEIAKAEEEAKAAAESHAHAHAAQHQVPDHENPEHPAFYWDGQMYGPYRAVSHQGGTGMEPISFQQGKMYTEREYKEALAAGTLKGKDRPYIPMGRTPEDLAELAKGRHEAQHLRQQELDRQQQEHQWQRQSHQGPALGESAAEPKEGAKRKRAIVRRADYPRYYYD